MRGALAHREAFCQQVMSGGGSSFPGLIPDRRDGQGQAVRHLPVAGR